MAEGIWKEGERNSPMSALFEQRDEQAQVVEPPAENDESVVLVD